MYQRLSSIRLALLSLIFAVAASAQTFQSIQPLFFTKQATGPNPLPQTVSVTSTGTAFSFSAAASTSSGGSWLSVSPSGFCCSTPGPIRVTVNDSANLAVGTYNGQVTLTVNSTITVVPVTLVVVAVGGTFIDTTPGHISFSMKTGGQPPPQTFPLRNGGTGTLSFSSAATTFNGSNFITATAGSGTAPTSLTVGVNPANLPGGGAVAGTYTGRILLQSSASSVSIQVSVYVGPDEMEQFQPLHFVKPFAGQNPLPQVVTGATLGTEFSFSAAAYSTKGGNWLSVSPSGFCCTTPRALTISANPDVTLAAGTYTGQVEITTSRRTMTIPVTLIVESPGVTNFDNLPGQLSFTMLAGSATPPAQLIDVRKFGSGALNWTLTGSTFESGAWLNVSATSGSAPSPLTVGITPANLPNGGQVAAVYTGQLFFQSGASSATVPVVVTVGPGFAQQNGLSFTMPFAGANPLPQTFIVASTGANFSFTVDYDNATGGNWLVVSPSGFCCTTPDAVKATVNAPAGLAAGTYTAQIRILSASTAISIPVSLTVAAPGTVFLDNLPGQLTFSAKTSATPAPQPVRIRANTGGAIAWTASASTSDGSPWLVISAPSGTAPSTLNVSIDRNRLPNAGLVAGVFSGQVLIDSAAGRYTIPVSVEIGGGFGQINGIHFTMKASGENPLPQIITTTSLGSNFSFTASAASATGGSWLSVSPSGFCCTTPRALRVSVNAPVGMPAGSYTGQVLLTRGTTSQMIPVTLTVLAPSAAGIDDMPGQLYFATRLDGSNPPSQTVQIRNRIAGAVTFSAQASTFDNAPWLTVSSLSGSSPSNVVIGINAANLPNAGLVAGVFTGQVLFTSSTGESTVTIPVVVAAGGNNPAQINGLHFTRPLAGASPLPQRVTVNSTGTVFSFTASRYSSTGGAWLSLTPTGFCCSTPQTMRASIATTPDLAAGTYVGQIDIDTPTVTQTIPVTLTVGSTAAPLLDNLQGQLSFSGSTGSSSFATQRVRIRNKGAGGLSWALSTMTFDNGSWLTTTSSSGTAPSTIEIGINKSALPNGGLVAGTFTGVVLIETAGGNTTIPVSVVIAQTFEQRGEIVFNVPFGGPNPAAQVVRFSAINGANFSFSAAAETGSGGAWLTSSKSGFCCTTTEDISLTVNVTGLAQGTYTGQLAATRDPSAAVVPVILVVGNGGTTPTLQSIAIGISAGANSILVGGTQQYSATGTYSDNSTANLTNLVTWGSSSTGVASIGANTGLATGIAQGSTNITASLSGVTSNTLALTVTQPQTTPVVTGITPNPVASGSSTFTINGTGFDPATVQVEINGSVIANAALTTRTATQLTFTTTLLSGAYSVVARNGSAGTPSNAVTLTVTGTPPPGSHFVPIAPCRSVDTRLTSIMARDSSRVFTFGACSIPSNATAIALNVTLVPSGPFGYLSIWPAGQPQPTVSTMNSLDGRIKANAAIVGLGSNGGVSIYVTDAAHIILDVNGYFVPAGTPGALAFYPITPCRVVDTRDPGAGGIVPALGIRRISGGCLPTTAQAYSLNMTVVPPAALGFLSLWPDGTPQPTVSTLNNLTGTVVANAAILRAGTGGAFNAFVTDTSHLIADLNGYFAPPGSPGALAFYPTAPCRIFDTRLANGAFGGPVMAADGTRSFTVPSSSCAIPTTAQAYVTNATVVPSGVFGFLTLWPGGQARPTVSTLNAVDGALTSNAAIVPAGTGGAISVYTSNSAHLLLDISGYFAP